MSYLARLENGSGFAVLPGCFQCDVTFSVPVKHSEEIIIGAGHNHTEGGKEEWKVTDKM